jgi:predicted nucleotidyltransferase
MLYSKKDKQKILNKIIEEIEQFSTVEGLVLVGSSANGKDDKYSDLDLSVCISPSDMTKKTWKTANNKLSKVLEPFFIYENEYGDNNYLSLFFLEIY